MKRALFVTVVLLADCGGGNRYVKSGATENDFKTDFATCEAEWQDYRLLTSEVMNACLRGKGWRLRPTS
jgi:hypothetical protein